MPNAISSRNCYKITKKTEATKHFTENSAMVAGYDFRLPVACYILTLCLFNRARMQYLRTNARVNANNEVKIHKSVTDNAIHKYGQIFQRKKKLEKTQIAASANAPISVSRRNQKCKPKEPYV